MSEVISQINEQRRENGFYAIPELLELKVRGNLILDPFSVLISSSLVIGSNNKFYNGVIIESKNNGTISIGDNNVFWPNSLIMAEYGRVQIGSNNQIGDGGVSIKANTKDANIIIGDNGRYLNGVQILGCSCLGSGSQVIGNITVQDCYLEEGESFKHNNPDARGGVLKGYGLARKIRVKTGMVINAYGVFKTEEMQKQAFFHPKK
jgi:acetyltransferase-like isoleucine patch superfamily enzyme